VATRTIDGPEQDWLDMHDLVRLTRLSEPTLRRLIRAGQFPRAVEVTKGVRMWPWTDLVYWSLLTAMRGRLSGTGQEQSPPDQEGSSDERDDSDA
jgi:predicted DNA-binding transcriptional regulator AlpA